MTDFHAQGRATGNIISDFIAPNPNKIAAQAAESVKGKLSAGAYGTDFVNGQWIITPAGQAAYGDDFQNMRNALMNAPVKAREAHEKAVDLGKKSIDTVMQFHAMSDKRKQDVRDNYSLSPEQKSEAFKAIDRTSFEAAKKYLPDIMQTQITAETIQNWNNLDNSDLQLKIFENNLNGYISEMDKSGFKVKLQDQTIISEAFHGLSDEDKARFSP
ncbi:MAG: hypothetical protein V1897_13165, partial [Pseudomonadota bacterium]